MEKVCGRSNAVSKALYQTLTGFSPVMAQELCYRASIDGNDDVQTLDGNTREQLYTEFTRLMEQIRRKNLPRLLFSKGTSRLNTVFFLFPIWRRLHHPDL